MVTTIPEIRAKLNDDGSESREIAGSIPYNEWSQVMYDYWGDAFVERIAAGAFKEAIQRGDQKALWNHDWGKPLGYAKSGTLGLMDGPSELRYSINVPDNSWGNDAAVSVNRGDTDGTSFGFSVMDDMWEIGMVEGYEGEIYMRTVMKADLYEVSPCTLPAYSGSTAESRALKCREHVHDELRQKRLALYAQSLI